ncbi:MAG: hypothetical protein QGG14_01160 [Planctomycetota bacterium]|nr:hypothetical protein [Planctomycetota bacterium]
MSASHSPSIVHTHQLTPSVVAQDPVIVQATINSTTSEPEVARSMLANQKGLAITADGRLWSLVYWSDGSWKASNPNKLDPQRNLSRHLLVCMSKDGGKSWSRISEARTTGEGYGSLVVDPDGYTLHIVWYAWNGKKTTANWYNSVFYAPYDTRRGQWIGSDQVLVAGSDPRTQTYSLPDIAITTSGVIGVVFVCARGVPTGWVGAGGSWNAGLLWFKNSKWSVPHRVNVGSTGVSPNIHAHGDNLHLSYRVAIGGYGICYRRFDTLTEKFGAEGELPVVPDPSNPKANIPNLRANNVSHCAVQPNGDVYVFYVTATAVASGGRHWFVYSKSGANKFSAPMQIDDDTGMGWGNNTYRFHNLARTGSGVVVAVYSKLVEKNRHLYARLLTPTGTLPPYPAPAIKLQTGTADNQFQQLSGYRDQRGLTDQWVTYSDLRPFGPLTGGAARLNGTLSGVGVFKGIGCAGNLKAQPELVATALPAIGKNLGMRLQSLPANAPGILFLGLDDKKLLGVIPLPFELVPFGMPGCFLSQDVPITIGFAADASGTLNLAAPLPNDPNFIGVPLFWQAFVIAVGANAGNAVLTNGLSLVAR